MYNAKWICGKNRTAKQRSIRKLEQQKIEGYNMSEDKEIKHFWLVTIASKTGKAGTLYVNTNRKLIPSRTLKLCEKTKEKETGYENAVCSAVSYLGYGTEEDFYNKDNSNDTQLKGE